MSTYPPDWYTDRDQEHADFLARAELDRAERHGDPLLHWPEADRVLARERAEALRRVSEPVCMERIRPARERDDGLDFARGMVVAFVLSVPVWALLAGLLVIAW